MVSPLEPLRGRVQKVQRVQRVQRVWYRLTAMSMKSALRDFLLCLQCCIMESRSPLPQEGGVTVRRRRIEASILGKNSDLSSGLRPAPSRSGKQKEGPFMGRLRANIARLGNPMQDCHLGKEPALRESPSYCISHAKHDGSEKHKTGPAARRKCTPIPAFGGTST